MEQKKLFEGQSKYCESHFSACGHPRAALGCDVLALREVRLVEVYPPLSLFSAEALPVQSRRHGLPGGVHWVSRVYLIDDSHVLP